MRGDTDVQYDLNRILIRPLYFGLTANVLLPVAGLFVCYYVQNNYGRDNMVGATAGPLFFVFLLLALGQAGFAVWWRRKRLSIPLISSLETLEDDLATNVSTQMRPVFLVIAAISVYGYVYYYLTGRFTETVVFVLASFLVFQLVRPRHGAIRKLIARQKELLGQSTRSSGP